MEIKFCGASMYVTGSCHLITTDAHKILLDCGQFQGGKEMEKLNYEPFPFDAEEVECVLLSHAHIDHCGRLPLLVRRGFKGQIYCTDATADLLEVMGAVVKARGYTWDDLTRVRKEKRAQRGAFEQRIFLKEVIE